MSDRAAPAIDATAAGQRAISQMRWWAAFVGVVVIVSQMSLGGIFWMLHDQARQRCVEGNRTRAAVADGFDQQRRVLLAAASSDEPPTADKQRAIDAYNAGIDQLIARFDPVDC